MKVCLIQPEYSTEYEKSDYYFEEEKKLMLQCDESADIIVCPEACDVPCLAGSRENAEASVRKYGPELMSLASETAKRCHAMLFISMSDFTETGRRNTTFAFDRNGVLQGKYYKQHLTPRETVNLDADYSFDFSEPTVIELEGYRFAFLTCYDFYFYENISNIARQRVDAIIGCSHQRSDTHGALEIMGRFISYNTNAYLLRASVSMNKESDIGGCSMVVTPKGDVVLNMKNDVGIAYAEIDLNEKYYKPAGFGNAPSAHYEYIEKGRRPWKYRPGGSAIARTDEWMKYPRLCAHRGFNAVAPESTMASFGAAIGLGADEIEFDLRPTADGEIVSIHDDFLERVSDGTGLVSEKTYDELLKYDFGIKFGEKFRGLRILKFEDILKKFSCHAVMNIHIKSANNTDPIDEDFLKKIIQLINKYDCRKHVYFMSGNDAILAQLGALAPDICRCHGRGDDAWNIVDKAIELGCQKVQFFKPFFNQEMIDKAHAHGIRCNVCWADDPEEAQKFFDMGIDTILTNDYLKVSQILK